MGLVSEEAYERWEDDESAEVMMDDPPEKIRFNIDRLVYWAAVAAVLFLAVTIARF